VWTTSSATAQDPGISVQRLLVIPNSPPRLKAAGRGDLDPVADAAHERNATLNYRGVLARELTAKDARLYLQARQYRRSRRPTPEDEAPDSV
jgi:hypothetical protein